MTAAVKVRTTNTLEDQKPMTLCQFQSRALPLRRRLNIRLVFKPRHFQLLRPPEINAGDGEPEKRQVACAGDGLPDGAALAVRSQPTVPIDDFMEEVVRRRQAAQQFAGVRIDENCILTAEINDN